MNLTEEARRLLSCEELRGRVPEDVRKFLREFLIECEMGSDAERDIKMALSSIHREYQQRCEPYVHALTQIAKSRPLPSHLYIMDTRHDPA